MEFFLAGLLLSFVYLGTLYYSRIIKKRELLHPIHIVSFFHFLFNAPFVLFLAIDEKKYFPSKYLDKISCINLELAIWNFTIVQILFFFFVILGIRFNPFRSFSFINRFIPIFSHNNKTVINLGVFFSFLIGLTSCYFFFAKNGGLINILLNLHLRTTFTNGNGYLLNGFSLLQISLFLFIYAKKGASISFRSKIIVGLLALFLVLIFSTLGGRKQSIFILFYIVFIYHYFISPIKIRVLKLFYFSFFISAFMILMPIIRKQGMVDKIIDSPSIVVDQFFEKGETIIVSQLSYVPTYVFIINYFDSSNAWYGSSFKDILFAPLPRKIYPNKPPVDDGVYFAHIINRHYVKPSVPFNNLYPVSYPGETLGTSYANFLLPGVIFFGFFLGGIYSFVYYLMIKSKLAFIQTYIYIITMMNFQFSNLRLVNFITVLVFNLLFLLIILFVSRIIKLK